MEGKTTGCNLDRAAGAAANAARDSSPAASPAPSRAPRRDASHASPPARRRTTLATCLLLLTFTLCPFPSPASRGARAQEVVDRMVATINGRELITYTDLLWQLALQPDTPLENPRPEDLRRALDLLVDQRLIAQEAGRLPAIAAKEEDVKARIAELVKRFPTQEGFQRRTARVGLTAEQLYEIVRQRVEIERYLDFRFRSFVVVTQKEVEDYYRDVFVPRWRRQQPGRIVPTIAEAAKSVEAELREAKIESDTDAFLEDARARAEIVFLDPALETRR
ncbi:MAG TPA: hypothetical protein VIP46_13430 [Pyrinomonadaceae bacterium]